MKLQTLLLATAGLLLISCDNELASENVPEPVREGFAAEFPDVRVLEWELIDQFYVAEFNKENIPYEVKLSREGKVLMYKYDIPQEQLPEAVKATISKEYSNVPIANAEILQYKGEQYYQVAFDGEARDYWLVFSKEGQKVDEPPYMK